MSVSEWADHFRVLTREASAEPGQWNTARAPYQREMMDALDNPEVVEETIMCSSQVGKTEIILNYIGRDMDMDPGPMLGVVPTIELAQAYSKDRLAPMIDNSPRLKCLVSDSKSRDSDNTLLHKAFLGGHLTLAGANSAASLASRPVRKVFFDEVDKFPASAGTAGDPIRLGRKRATTFFDKKYLYVSTPTDEASRIAGLYESSDQRRYYVPCPNCGGMHTLEWKQIHWDKDPDGNHLPETAAHFCPHCGGMETDADLPAMLAGGEWRKGKPEVKHHAGFHINELYSPWVSFAETVQSFLDTKSNPEQFKTWTNEAMGEVFRLGKNIESAEALLFRRENYTSTLVPSGGVAIVMGVDVQDDRLETEVVAYGRDYESWSIDYLVFPGSPANSAVWERLDDYRRKLYEHESGYKLRVVATAIDTGGHHTGSVYKYVKAHEGENVFAIKGAGGSGRPPVGRASKSNAGKVNLYTLGVDSIKDTIAAHIQAERGQPGYCHFPHSYAKAYFEQLLAEHPVYRVRNRRQVRVWEPKRTGIRNEALDNRVYALAALMITGCDLNSVVAKFEALTHGFQPPVEPQTVPARRRYRSRGVA
jgi:phage terminase large subunit GpA-like protein